MNALLGPVGRWVGASTGRRKITINTGWLLFDKLVRALLGLAVGAWVARYLGPAQYGELAYALAFIALFQALANLGVDAIVVRELAQDRSSAPVVLGTSCALRLAAGLVCWLVAIASAAWLNPDRAGIVLNTAIVGGLLVFQAADSIDLWFQSQSQSRLTVVAKLAAYLVAASLKVALILLGASVTAFAAVLAFEAGLAALTLVMAYRRSPATERWRIDARVARSLLRQSMPFALSGLAIMVYMRIDQIMISEMLGDRELGVYAAIMPLSQFWQVIPLTLATSLAPFIARRRGLADGRYAHSLVLVFRAFFYLGAATAVVMWWLADPLVRALLGPAFAEGAAALRIYSLSNVFCFLGIAHGLWLVNERRSAVRLFGTLLAGLAAVVGNWQLLPILGLAGAAWTAVLSQCVAAFLINAVLDRPGLRLQLSAIFFVEPRGHDLAPR